MENEIKLLLTDENIEQIIEDIDKKILIELVKDREDFNPADFIDKTVMSDNQIKETINSALGINYPCPSFRDVSQEIMKYYK